MTADVRLELASVASCADVASVEPAGKRRRWLVAPWFDLLLVANVAWPLLLLVQWNDGFEGRAGLQFWQVYYATTPHRWVTLLIVFLDRERFSSRKSAFLAIAALVTAVCVGIRLATGALTCLLAVDYLWNAWHFAAQHHGIYRIYCRLNCSMPQRADVWEKLFLRAFLLYVIARVALAAWSEVAWQTRLQTLDWIAAAVALALLFNNFTLNARGGWSSTAYLASVCTLYLSLLWAVHAGRPDLVLSLTTASALFHAVEYLAVVSWSVAKRNSAAPSRLGPSRLGMLGYLAPRWGLVLGLFIVALGSAGWLLDQHLMNGWLLLNVIAAFLHYAYDGLIWRQRPGSTAAATLTTARIGR